MTARLCPACVHRRARLVDPACPVCEGAGVLELGHAEHITSPHEAAHAVAIALEAVARRVETDHPDPTARAAAAPPALAAALAALVRVGILEGNPAAIVDPHAGPVVLAQSAILEPVRPLDWTLADAAAYAYQPGDRPMSRGMPVLSADGHPSHLARITDPADPDTPTAEVVRRRDADRRAGRVLAEAAREAVSRRPRPSV